MTTRSFGVLTPRERQIFDCLLQGSTTREIADSYGLERQTVKNYVTVIYEKCGVSDRSQLLQWARSSVAGPMGVAPEA